jgi:hypothetical protein
MQQNEQMREIAAIIARLLTHFRQRDEPIEIFTMLADDWIKDVAEFGVAIVAETAREWRQNHDWAPKIAEFRRLCRESRDTANWRSDRALPKPEHGAGVVQRRHGARLGRTRGSR